MDDAKGNTVVVPSPDKVQRDAQNLFRESAVPETFAFFNDLSPVNQRLFVIDLWHALSRSVIDASEGSIRDLLLLIEGWEATAELDSDPEASASLQRPSQYKPFKVA